MKSPPMSNKQIEIIVRELNELVLGGAVRTCFQFDKKKLLISIEKNAYGHNLLISLRPPGVRIHLTRMKLKKLRNRLPFGEYLKKAILETRVIGILQIDNDRIVRIDFEGENRMSLYIEVFSKGRGMYMADKDDIVEASLNGDRIGEKYTHTPSVIHDGPDIQVPDGELLNFILDEKYREIEEQEEFDEKKKLALDHLHKKKKKLDRLLHNLEKDHQKCLQWEEFNLHGELLKANLNTLKGNSPAVRVVNYYTNEEVEIPLDKRIPVRANMELKFKKARKFRRGLEAVEKNRERAEKRLVPVNKQLQDVERIDNPEELDDYISTNNIRLQAAISRKPDKKMKARSPFRYFLSKNGTKIYVGRSNAENDKITVSFGKGSDFWAHAHGYPGSHVLVPVPKNAQIDHQTFIDAINLALYFSKARNSGAGDVMYTEKRYVSKTRGLAPGKVNVSKHKVIHVKLEDDRIRDIKERTKELVG